MNEDSRAPSRIPALNELRGELVRVAETESKAPRRRLHKPAAATFVGGLMAAGVATAILVSGGGGDGGSGTSGGASANGLLEVYSFDSLPEMLATSDLVIEGTVTSVKPGRVVGGDPKEDGGGGVTDESSVESSGAIQFTEVAISVNRTLYGSVPDKAGEILVEEESDVALGGPSKVGDHAIYFLHRKLDAPGYFRLVSSQGRFLETIDGGLVASNDEQGWVREVESMDLDELEDAVVGARAQVEAGRVEPAEPVVPID